MDKKLSSGKIVAVVFGSLGTVIALLIVFTLSLYQLVQNPWFLPDTDNQDRKETMQASREGEGDEKETYREDPDRDEKDSNREDEDRTENEEDFGLYKDGKHDKEQIDSEYYDFHNDIQRDLSYQIEFRTYQETYGDHRNISVEMDYPVVTGRSADDLEGINNAIYKEVEAVETYGKSVTDWLPNDEEFRFETECYVTYMDEDILSIIYVEYGYLEDEIYESYVIPVNIDMESRMALTNSQILNINDAFSIEFRERCERQNGEIQFFSLFSDQDITYLLTDEDSLIIFYTPLGMEIGFNYYYGWVTVTYKDYQKYQNQL
ncbi:MAG: hypothetical protein K2H52_10305 [Lachnospiraceae bacterium]|nr:hypothetical protein [Lachnospiraceae bacterium]MDE6184198.1 hypothetical protein [Lachnospiraceae bacterium]